MLGCLMLMLPASYAAGQKSASPRITPEKATLPRAEGKPRTRPANSPQEKKSLAIRQKAGQQKAEKPTLSAADRAETRLEAVLDESSSVRFIKTPLADAAMFLSQQHDIPIVIHRRALEEIGLDPSVPVTLDVSNISLRSVLRLLLRDIDATYLIKDEVLQITTREAAENRLIVKIYQLPEAMAGKTDELLEVVPTIVHPDAWETLGGASTLAAFDGMLIAQTTSEVHAELRSFLAKLAEQYKR
jgi:hypothetical protein